MGILDRSLSSFGYAGEHAERVSFGRGGRAVSAVRCAEYGTMLNVI